LYRNWTAGPDTFVAKYIESKNGKAQLQRKDSEEIEEITLSRLSKDDRDWIRDELKLRAEDKRAAAESKKRQSKKTPKTERPKGKTR